MPSRISDMLHDGLCSGNVGWVMHLNNILQTEFPYCAQIAPIHWFDSPTNRMPMFWTRSWTREAFTDTCEYLWGAMYQTSINRASQRIMCTVPDSYDRMWIMGIANSAYEELYMNFSPNERYLVNVSPGDLTIWVGDRVTRALGNPNFVWQVIETDFLNVRAMEECFYYRTVEDAVYEFIRQGEHSLGKTKAIQALVKDLADNYIHDIDVKNLYKLVLNENNSCAET